MTIFTVLAAVQAESHDFSTIVAYLLPLLIFAVAIGAILFVFRKLFPSKEQQSKKQQRRVENTWNPYH